MVRSFCDGNYHFDFRTQSDESANRCRYWQKDDSNLRGENFVSDRSQGIMIYEPIIMNACRKPQTHLHSSLHDQS